MKSVNIKVSKLAVRHVLLDFYVTLRSLIIIQDQIQLIGVQFSEHTQGVLLQHIRGYQIPKEFDIFHRKTIFFS